MSENDSMNKDPVLSGVITPEKDAEDSIENYLYETRPFYRVNYLCVLAFHIFIITLTSTNNGFDGSMLNGLQSLTYWADYMGNPTGHILGALTAGGIFGCFLIFFIAPWACDKYGRRTVVIIGQAITLIGAILQGLSTNYAFFLCSRLVIGAGSGLATIGAPTLISELSYPAHREACTFAYNICWYLGATVAAIVTYLTRNISNNWCWRIPSYLQGFFPLVQLVFLLWVPESPRFLVAKGKHDNARALLLKYHTGNSTDPRASELVEFELREIESALEAEKLAGASSKYSDFWYRPSYRKRIFLVLFIATMMQLSGNGLVSYYLNKVLNSIGITDTSKQLQINMCLMIFNFVICVVCCATCHLFRRRTLFITCVVGMLITYIIWTALSAENEKQNFSNKSLANGVLAMIFFYYMFYDIGINGLPFLYVTEILPYSHRAKGINLFQFWMQIVLVYNSFVNPIAMDAISWKYYIVYCCILGVETVVVILTFPETSGRTLEEVAEVFGDVIDHGEAKLHQEFNEVKRTGSVEHLESV
uniref:MFS transporter n=1 Tax=Cyberlindnera americana TaxID=36016 RepID=A0A5P8N922_9ASCO|nr:MFS transporter [Cyberlindnera americana]